MAISFNNIPNTQRTPAVLTEIDNSRALQGLATVPHKVLMIGQKTSAGTAEVETLQAITRDGLQDGFFGAGSVLARMAKTFKTNNPNTELVAMALSNNGGVTASGLIKFDSALSATTNTTYFLMINGVATNTTINSGWSVTDANSAIIAQINANSNLPIVATTSASAAGSDHIVLSAVQSGTLGNYINVRANFFAGESMPAGWSASGVKITQTAGGSVDPSLDDVWAVVAEDHFQYIVQPYIDATNLKSLEDELETRFGPLVDLQGHAFGAARSTQASATTLGNSRNSPHNTIMPANDSPTSPEEWAAAVGAQASFNLNQDPARPLHFLKLKDIVAPPAENRFTLEERNILLFDGMATFAVDTVGNVQIERLITTFQTNAVGLPDSSYLDVNTLATIAEIRFQYKLRMVTRFLIPRFKLADDTFPVQPGANIVTPATVKAETISLFTQLRDIGLIENLAEFADNLIVERNSGDPNRVDVLLPPDLINQFRILAGKIQFIL